MELMPHIKSLLNDLITITKNITIKRSDIALDNDTNYNTISLYNQYRAILNNEDNFYTYQNYPADALRQIRLWKRINNITYELPFDNSSYINEDGSTVYINNNLPDNNDERNNNKNIWIYKNGVCLYFKLYKKSITKRNANIRFYDSNTLLDSFYMDNIAKQKLNLYIKDNTYSYYLKVLYKLYDEYMPSSSANLTVYDDFGNKYLYDRTGNQYNLYVYNKEFNNYVIKNSDDDNEVTYIRRSVIEYYYVDKDYYIYEDYFKDGENPSHYTKINNTQYYKIDNYTFIEKDQYNGNDIPDIYYKYTNDKAGAVDFNIDNGNRFYRNIYYSYNSINVLSCNQSYEYMNEDLSTYYYYYAQSNTGDYIFNGTSYVPYINQTGTRYNRITTSTKYLYSINNNEYIPVTEYVDDNTYIYYCPGVTTYMSTQRFTDIEITSMTDKPNLIPSEYRDILISLMRTYVKNSYCPDTGNPDFIVDIYHGETNSYYRELNGLPAIEDMPNQPRINRLDISPSYTGDDINPYIYNLTDKEVSIIEKNGVLDSYITQYPSRLYLRHIGANRIDVVKARDAYPYQIIKMGKYNSKAHLDMFNENYSIARDFILNRYYQPEIFDVTNTYYGSYIVFLIIVQAMCQCISKSNDLLLKNEFTNEETVNLILESYGFKDTFNSIPFVYRKNIAKNITLLITNKGTDNIYKLVYKIFNIASTDIYKYLFHKYRVIDDNGNVEYKKDEDDEFILDTHGNKIPKYDLSLVQSQIDATNIFQYILDSSDIFSYDDITLADKYWGVYESNDSVREKIEKFDFNYMNSKYISINNKFNLTQLNLNCAYFMNYMADLTKDRNDLYLYIEGLENSQSLFDLMVTLFAIQAERIGFAGNIPNDVISTASIYKFNLDDKVVDLDNKITAIFDYYYKYMTKDGVDRCNALKEKMNTDGAIVRATTSDDNVNSVMTKYYLNLIEDAESTAVNENSIYKEIIDMRNKAVDKHDYDCFNALLECISISETTNLNYKYASPIWEKIYTGKYSSEDDEYTNQTWLFENMNKIWIKIQNLTDANEFIENYSESNTKIINGQPYLYDAKSYDYVVNINNSNKSFVEYHQVDSDVSLYMDNKYELYKSINIFDSIKEFTTDNVDINIELPNDGYIYISKDIINTHSFNENINGNGLPLPYYIHVSNIDANTYAITIYKRTDVALSYKTYLRETNDEIYKYISKRDSEDRQSYLTRINGLYSTILYTIDNEISDEYVKNKLQLSYIDFTNVTKYIKLLINVFKSYTVDMTSMNASYEIDDDTYNRIKIIDDMTCEGNIYYNKNIYIRSDLEIGAYLFKNDAIKILDELIIE